MRLKQLALISLFIFPYPISAQNGEILHYAETTGFNHNTAQQSQNLFQTIATNLGLTLVHDMDGSSFDTFNNLQRFDLVIFSNTSGDQGLNATQRANFEQYIANGGSYLGIHAASDTYRHSSANGSRTGTWDWYAETVCGASVQQGPNHTANNYAGTMTFLQTGSVLDQMMPSPWNKPEEYYYWENGYLSPDFQSILEVAQTGNNSYDAPRMMAQIRDLPGGGRAFYTALGHNTSNFSMNTDFGQFMVNAVSWIRSASALPIDFDLISQGENTKIGIVNPCENTLTVYMDLEKSMPVSLSVYDLTGRKLYEFIEENPQTGSWKWDNEINLPRGLYGVSIQTLGEKLFAEKLWVR